MVTDSGATRNLVALMTAARDSWTAQREREMLAAIARTQLMVPTDTDPSTGEQAVTLSLDPAGAPVAVAFTSLEELERWAADTPMNAGWLSGRELARAALAGRATALFIDLASEHGGKLAGSRIDVIAGERSLEFEAENESGVMRLRTTERPLVVVPPRDGAHTALVETLRTGLGRSPQVAEAWLVEVEDPPPRRPLLALVVDDPAAGLPTAVQEALAGGVGAAEYVDVYPIARSQWDGDDFAGVRRGLRVWPPPPSRDAVDGA